MCSYDYDFIPLCEIEMYIGNFTTLHKQRSASLTNRFVFASQLANGRGRLSDNNALNQRSIYIEFKIRRCLNEVMASIFISVRYMFGITTASQMFKRNRSLGVLKRVSILFDCFHKLFFYVVHTTNSTFITHAYIELLCAI